MKFQCKNIECSDIGKIYDIKVMRYKINSQGDVVCAESKCPTCRLDMEDISLFEGYGKGIRLSGIKSKSYYKKFKKQ